MTRFTSAMTLWSTFCRLAGLGCGWALSRRRKSKSRGVNCSNPSPIPRRFFFLIYRTPLDEWPVWSKPTGGLVVNVDDMPYAYAVACERYHIGPRERLWVAGVTESRRCRKAAELHVLWEQEMARWLEEVTSG